MGLKHGDLKNSIESDISIDEFEPKSGHDEEVIVVGLFGNNDLATKDLEDFITKGTTGIIDVDVSPNPNEEGNFMLFVEMPRNEEFPKQLRDLLSDIENLTGSLAWRVSPYLSDDYFAIDDPRWEQFVMVTADDVVTKDDFEAPDLDDLELEEPEEEMEEDLDESFRTLFNPTMANVLTVEGNTVILEVSRKKIKATLMAKGKFVDIIEQHNTFLHEAKFDLRPSMAVRAFQKALSATYSVTSMDTYQQVFDGDSNLVYMFTEVEYA